MRVAALLLACAGLAVAQQAPPAWPGLEDVLGGRIRYASPLPRWTWQGEQLQRADGRLLDPDTGAEQAASEQVDPHVLAFQELPGFGRLGRRALAEGQRGAGWMLVEREQRLAFHRIGEAARELSRADSPLRQGLARPAGDLVAALHGHDVVLVDTASGERRAITRDGSAERLTGELDWVYQEELYGRGRWRAMWWSPDGAWLAVLRLEQEGVSQHPIVDLRAVPSVQFQRFPRPGEPNPRVSLGVVEAATGALRWLDLSRLGSDCLVVDVGWWVGPAGRPELLASVQDRAQRWLECWAHEPTEGASRRLVREEDSAWVERLPLPLRIPGGFLWESDRDGLRRLYRYRDPGGAAEPAVEAAAGWPDRPIRQVLRADAEGALVLAGETAPEQQLYRLRFDGPPTLITPEPGWHDIELSPSGTWLLDRHSSLLAPPVLKLREASGTRVRELGRSTVAERWRRAPSVRFGLRARDGTPLDASAVLPAEPRPPGGYPVWLSTYSGPNAPTVRDAWHADSWDQFLAGQGVAVLRVNVRSASGRGHRATRSCYRRLGAGELADLEDGLAGAARALGLDASRAGITGSSYGGFIAAYAMTHSTRFRLGVAVSGVYDWRLYDSIYTERYMDLPERNPEGYRASSCVLGAGGLSGRLLIAHGMLDDNVHFAHAVRLAAALQDRDRPHELALYPGAGHGMGRLEERRDLLRRTWRLIEQELLGR